MDNFIGGKFVPPVKGQYFDNISPIDGQVFSKAAKSTKEDVELALDAGVATKTHVLNLLHRLIDGKTSGGPGIDTPQALALRHEPKANVERYDDLRAQILAFSQSSSPADLDALGTLDHRVGLAFAEAARALLQEFGHPAHAVAAIGSHGQTLRHRPDAAAPFTMQIGDPSLIAEICGITTVADFRRRDMAAGGQGAPLVPAFHASVLRSPAEDRAVLNLGGIGNLTLLPTEGPVQGFDTGPANGLMDAWILHQRGLPFDEAGAYAASGTVETNLLERLIAEPYFERKPPKSSGRDHFHLQWLKAPLQGLQIEPQHVQATLLELTARSVANALLRWLPQAQRLLVCGGGVHNRTLMGRLAELLPRCAVQSTSAHGIDPDFMEAMTFAWLARETLAGRPGNLPSATGARGERILGAIHPA